MEIYVHHSLGSEAQPFSFPGTLESKNWPGDHIHDNT